MKRQTWPFLILAYALSWLIWITARHLGVSPHREAYLAAFGVAGPAIAAVFLSRRGPGNSTELLSFRLLSFFLLWLFAGALTWLYNRSGGNLLSVTIFHAAMNTFPALLPHFPKALALVIVFAVMVIFSDRMWRLRSDAPAPRPPAPA